MTSSPRWAVQVAVRAHLLDDAEISQRVSGVWDHVPEGETLPWITLGDAPEQPDNTHDSFGAELSFPLHIWTDHRGARDAAELVDLIMRRLDHQVLDLDGHRTVMVHHDRTTATRDTDPTIRHAVLTFRIHTEETS